MAIGESLARSYIFEVSEDAVAYTTVSGVNNWSLKFDETMKDSTTFDTNGYGRKVKTQRGVTVMFEGVYEYDSDTGDRDPGQQMIDESTKDFGAAGVRYYRISHATDEGSVLTFKGVAAHDDMGGKNDEIEAWKVTISMYGAPTSATGAWANLF